MELKELREKILPDLDDDFLASLGDFDSLDALRTDIRTRLEANAIDRARHRFADRIIEYSVANASVELPEVLVDQEVEVMHDSSGLLARQGISAEAYLKAVDKVERGHPRRVPAERRESAPRRARAVEDRRRRGLEVPDADRRRRGRPRGRRDMAGDNRNPVVLRLGSRPLVHPQHVARSRVSRADRGGVARAHPEHPALPHLEDAPGSAVAHEGAQANAGIGATDPGTVLDTSERPPVDEPAAAG